MPTVSPHACIANLSFLPMGTTMRCQLIISDDLHVQATTCDNGSNNLNGCQTILDRVAHDVHGAGIDHHGKCSLHKENVHVGGEDLTKWSHMLPPWPDDLLISPVFTFMSLSNMSGESDAPDRDQTHCDLLEKRDIFGSLGNDAICQEYTVRYEEHKTPEDVDDGDIVEYKIAPGEE